jgi:glycyl-tRNA synthetase alpha subunit
MYVLFIIKRVRCLKFQSSPCKVKTDKGIVELSWEIIFKQEQAFALWLSEASKLKREYIERIRTTQWRVASIYIHNRESTGLQCLVVYK